eukprot:TRINITY_DN11454_c0_g1_i1.p2 TRINITY_DN11454_c0_g1~~TRINITY_DN11454_c0_g1_i1.p2  ORF type:complete len:277 (+),score=76.77 TRINITY_DN11454_c0_g1_i1:90-920(+)
MGSLSKRLGQLSARSIESESTNIIRTMRANKIPGSLSQRLDTTLKDSHDMKVFGLGTLSAMASVPRYARFTNSMLAVYGAMEEELDECVRADHAGVARFWSRHGDILRRAAVLEQDLRDVVPAPLPPSPATAEYVAAIRAAGAADRATGSGRVLGHAYTRYLADLMGGSVLGAPTRMALGLAHGTPRHYAFGYAEQHGGRRAYVEALYGDLNAAGDVIAPEAEGATDQERAALLEAVVAETRLAFAMNVKVYAEEPIYADAARGAANVIVGWALRR